MSSEPKELKVENFYHFKKVMYLAKELLLSTELLNLVSTTNSSSEATKAAEALVRLGYVTFENIQTLTEVKNDHRAIRLIITLKKTANFKKLYDENQEFKKQKESEREKESKETKKDSKKETTKKK